ncbi:MAG: glycosyltransferase family 4 protein [Bacteroidaceae bacterium]|nr:glycosyltransferase family 4 protein [Bacteroidaceae bacterium]
MNIYHIISNKVWGGGEQYVFDMCQHLIRDGHHVELFCRPFPPVVSKLQALGVPIHPVALRGLASVYRIARVIGEGGGILHVHNFKDAFPACFAASMVRGGRVKVIVTRHLVRKGKTSLPYRWLYKKIDKIIFVSALAKQTFLSTHPAVAEEKLEVLHNSIASIVPSEVESIRETLNLPDDAVVGMYHGRLAQEKGLDTLLEAMQMVDTQNLHLVLIGNGEEVYVNALKQQLVQRGLESKVHFLGFKHHVISYIPQADFGILASIVREACPLSCMEYMSQGKAVVATNNGGQAEYVEDGRNGVLVPPSDAQALAIALKKLAENEACRTTLGEQAREDFSSRFSYDKFYKKILSIYQV